MAAKKPRQIVIKLKRAYEPPERTDGSRVLVDRLWPRGLTKSSARIDLWLKELAPSTALRNWFSHDPSRWDSFRARYLRELEKHPEAVQQLDEHLRRGAVTLVFAAKDTEHNNAVALKEYIESGRKQS
jgi:uncharacterized protein YeaO (DUF488 family)